jgi:hypothetical protein
MTQVLTERYRDRLGGVLWRAAAIIRDWCT